MNSLMAAQSSRNTLSPKPGESGTSTTSSLDALCDGKQCPCKIRFRLLDSKKNSLPGASYYVNANGQNSPKAETDSEGYTEEISTIQGSEVILYFIRAIGGKITPLEGPNQPFNSQASQTEIYEVHREKCSEKKDHDVIVLRDITPEEAKKINDEAKEWAGTRYTKSGNFTKYIGDSAQKHIAGDCTGTTWYIYHNAGFPYMYWATGEFDAQRDAQKTSGTNKFIFRRFKAKDEERQVGDIANCGNYGHVVIVGDFADIAALTFLRPKRYVINDKLEHDERIRRDTDRKMYKLTPKKINKGEEEVNEIVFRTTASVWSASSKRDQYMPVREFYTDEDGKTIDEFKIKAYYRYQKVNGTIVE